MKIVSAQGPNPSFSLLGDFYSTWGSFGTGLGLGPGLGNIQLSEYALTYIVLDRLTQRSSSFSLRSRFSSPNQTIDYACEHWSQCY